MNALLVIIYGAAAGLIASKFRGSGFGLWWDIYLGIAGSTFAGLIMFYGYFLNVFAKSFTTGLDLYNIAADIAGAVILIYAARLYHRTIRFRRLRSINFRQAKVRP